MSSQDKTLLLYAMMSSCGDPVSAHSNIFAFFPIKFNDVTIKNLISKMQEVKLYSGLSLIIRRLSFNSNKNFLFFLVSTLKPAKDGEWLQSNK